MKFGFSFIGDSFFGDGQVELPDVSTAASNRTQHSLASVLKFNNVL